MKKMNVFDTNNTGGVKKLSSNYTICNSDVEPREVKKGSTESEQIKKALTKDIGNIDETSIIGNKLLKLIYAGIISDKGRIKNLGEFQETLLDTHWSVVERYTSDIIIISCDIYGCCDKYTLNEINTDDTLILGSDLNGNTSVFVINKGIKSNQKLHLLVKRNPSNNYTILDSSIGGIFSTESNLLDNVNQAKVVSIEQIKGLGFTVVQDIEIPHNSKYYNFLFKRN